jgi:prolyl oligopeptidase PreP (S9A serine peptidase family)
LLARIAKDEGHSGSDSLKKIINNKADIFAFLAKVL